MTQLNLHMHDVVRIEIKPTLRSFPGDKGRSYCATQMIIHVKNRHFDGKLDEVELNLYSDEDHLTVPLFVHEVVDQRKEDETH